MEKSRNYVVFGVLALVVSLVAVSLAYAGFSQTLNISGNATVKAVNWNVHFANVQNVVTTGAATVTQPTTKGPLTIGDYDVTFTTPGEKATLVFDVVNTGDFNAKWMGLTIGSKSCSGPSNANDVCNNITYKLYTGGNGDSGTEVTEADEASLAARTGSRTFSLVLTYLASDSTSVLPAGSDAVVTIGTTSLVFAQDGNYVTP